MVARFPDFPELACGASNRDESMASALSALKEEIERRIRGDAEFPVLVLSAKEKPLCLSQPQRRQSAPLVVDSCPVRSVGRMYLRRRLVLGTNNGPSWSPRRNNCDIPIFQLCWFAVVGRANAGELGGARRQNQWVVSRTLTDRIARPIWTCALAGMILYVDASTYSLGQTPSLSSVHPLVSG